MMEQRERQEQKAADHAKHYGTDLTGQLANILQNMRTVPVIEGHGRVRPDTPSSRRGEMLALQRRRAKEKRARRAKAASRHKKHRSKPIRKRGGRG